MISPLSILLCGHYSHQTASSIRRGGGAPQTHPISIYGPFKHFLSLLSSAPHSCDSPVITPTLSRPLYLRANLLKTAIFFLPPHPSPFAPPPPTPPLSPLLPPGSPSPRRQTSPSSHLSARPPSLISLPSHLHPSFSSPTRTTPALPPVSPPL